MEKYQYEIIRSQRKSVSLEIRPDCRLVVRAPLKISDRQIAEFVRSKEAWLDKWLPKQQQRQAAKKTVALSKAQVLALKNRGRPYLEARCRYYARQMGVTYESIKINSATTRWGSCSSTGNLNFAYRLLLAEPELIDYVVVHELAHRREMNHSPRFWAVVEAVMPDYQKRRAQLKAFQHQLEIVEKESS